MKNNIKVKKIDNCYGTSFWGKVINTSKNELVKKLGIEPNCSGADYKTTYEWCLEITNGEDTINCTIYDYKEGVVGDNTKIDFHIGTKTKGGSYLAISMLKELLEK